MTAPLHVAIVTETYPPEVNGVAMTLERMLQGLLARGHRVSLTRPRQHAQDAPAASAPYSTTLVRGLPIPGYAGLKFGLPARRLLRRQWRAERPDVVQVVTEGPLGASAIAAARDLGIPVVSEFHTNFHAYSRHYGLGWLEGLVAAHLRRLHNRSRMTLVPSRELGVDLLRRGYRGIRVVARGVDTALFNPARRSAALRAAWKAGDGDLVVTMSAAWRRRRTCRYCLPASRRSAAMHRARACYWLATARREGGWPSATPTASSPACAMARTSPPTTPLPTCSCFRA